MTSLSKNDKLLVKRFNLLENPYRINVASPPYQMITEKNELLIEYMSYYTSDASYKGAEFQVDLIQEGDFCYDTKTQGSDYAGTKSITETYEECVAWENATQCPDFPWEGTNGIHLLNSGNSCRNLDTVGMLQPWCYGYVKGTMCTRRYCDVCNIGDSVDKVKGCKDYIKQDPHFCRDAIGRFGCFKTCEMDTSHYDKTKVKCAMPEIPSGVTVMSGLTNQYDVDASIFVSCGGVQTTIQCTTQGWTPFDESCAKKACIDAHQLCSNTITKFPDFCTNPKSKASAMKYCRKSCGQCRPAFCPVEAGSSFYPVSTSRRLVKTGTKVVFSCNGGLQHVAGDLSRSCSASGLYLGTEPVCQVKPLPKDVNLAQIYDKDKTLSKRTAFLMLGAGLNVPFNGKLTRWFYFCKKAGKVTLLVYRKTRQNTYSLVGSTEVTCVPGWPWSHKLATNDNINVRQGDLLGVYDASSVIAFQPCGDATQITVLLATYQANTATELIGKKSATFNGRGCGFIGIGATVIPN